MFFPQSKINFHTHTKHDANHCLGNLTNLIGDIWHRSDAVALTTFCFVDCSVCDVTDSSLVAL